MSKETFKTIIKIILMIVTIILIIFGIALLNSKELDKTVESKIRTSIEGQSVEEEKKEENNRRSMEDVNSNKDNEKNNS